MQSVSFQRRTRPGSFFGLVLMIAFMFADSAIANEPPYIHGTPPVSVPVDTVYDFAATAGDANGDPLHFEIWNRPEWANFSNGRLWGTPTSVGTWSNIQMFVYDGDIWVEMAPFSIEVTAGAATSGKPANGSNQIPTFSGTPETTAKAGVPYTFSPVVADADGDALIFHIWNRPEWAQFSNGKLWGTPTEAGVWSDIQMFVFDGTIWIETTPFTITVTDSGNQPPTITGTPSPTAVVGKPYSFAAAVNDPDGDALHFEIWNRPEWASFSKGKLSGTPPEAGTWKEIQMFVYDGHIWVVHPPFSITATKSTANGAPVISGTPATTAKVGQTYEFKAVASDPEGSKLTFSIVNKPSWAAFTNGVLSGKPTAAGSWSNIVISVSDGKLKASLPAFAITAAKETTGTANRAPTISGSPAASVQAGVSYSFQPAVSDPDGDALYFSIANKPSWAAFNTATGLLSGTPADAHIGSYAGIAITVTDGKASVTKTFAIAVKAKPAVTGTARLIWTPPTENVDGSALIGLAGYRIHYGTVSTELTQMIDLPDAAASEYVVKALTPGKYYFAIKAYNEYGEESDLSNVAAFTVL